MKFNQLLPFAAVSAALVFPPEQVLSELAIEDHHSKGWTEEAISAKNDIASSFEKFLERTGKHATTVTEELASDLDDFFHDSDKQAKNAWNHLAEGSKSIFNDAFEKASHGLDALEEQIQDSASDFEAWLESEGSFEMFEEPHHPPPPHHGPPHHPPGHGPPDHDKPHHPDPHHPKNPHKFNQTVYQLLTSNNYTTKLAKLINEYPELVETLNSTKANVTVFAPTDKAFEKIPEHAPKPSKEQLLAILQYHVLPDSYPAFRVLSSHTAPTLLLDKSLGSTPQLQRVAFKLSLRGLTVNWFSRVIVPNIFGTNGVIHGVDSLIIPPPRALTIIELLPGSFSTLELGLTKTGLFDELNSTKPAGGTLFAPSNFAFEKLGPKINAFLFSKYGEKYLRALLEYHVVPKQTLYSDAYYDGKSSEVEQEDIPKGRFHVELPTLLKDRSLSVDVARFGGFITIKVNGFVTVAVQDVIAQDGVIHVLRSVLIPPKKLGGTEVAWDGSELSVEELKERLEPYVAKFDL